MELSAHLESLPESLLLESVLPLLDQFALGRLACCNRRFCNVVASADHLWLPILISEYYSRTQYPSSPPHPWRTWHQLFCFKQNRRCIECRTDTPYVYTLTESRFPLCERCEYACPKYALITKLEAKQRYLLTDEDLHSLPYKKICRKRFCVLFFLKSNVESIASRKGIASGSGGEAGHIHDNCQQWSLSVINQTLSENGDEHVHYIEGLEIDEPEKNTEQRSFGEPSRNRVHLDIAIQSPDKENVEFMEEDDLNEQEASKKATANSRLRSHRRELRKEHKKQVKAAKKEQRFAQKNTINSKNGKSPSSYTGPLKSNEKHYDKKKKKRWRIQRDHGMPVESLWRMEVAEGKSKARSDWVKEREWLEIELGPYGITVLELAPDP